MASVPVAARTTREAQRPLVAPPLAVRVKYGDSLWTIARQYGDPNRDVREVVDAISKENGVEPGRLQPGETLRIPAEYLAAGR
jgi:Tfp pilus assembly protein FimV